MPRVERRVVGRVAFGQLAIHGVWPWRFSIFGEPSIVTTTRLLLLLGDCFAAIAATSSFSSLVTTASSLSPLLPSSELHPAVLFSNASTACKTSLAFFKNLCLYCCLFFVVVHCFLLIYSCNHHFPGVTTMIRTTIQSGCCCCLFSVGCEYHGGAKYEA
jgi:hypothetical protein